MRSGYGLSKAGRERRTWRDISRMSFYIVFGAIGLMIQLAFKTVACGV